MSIFEQLASTKTFANPITAYEAEYSEVIKKIADNAEKYPDGGVIEKQYNQNHILLTDYTYGVPRADGKISREIKVMPRWNYLQVRKVAEVNINTAVTFNVVREHWLGNPASIDFTSDGELDPIWIEEKIQEQLISDLADMALAYRKDRKTQMHFNSEYAHSLYKLPMIKHLAFPKKYSDVPLQFSSSIITKDEYEATVKRIKVLEANWIANEGNTERQIENINKKLVETMNADASKDAQISELQSQLMQMQAQIQKIMATSTPEPKSNPKKTEETK